MYVHITILILSTAYTYIDSYVTLHSNATYIASYTSSHAILLCDYCVWLSHWLSYVYTHIAAIRKNQLA